MMSIYLIAAYGALILASIVTSATLKKAGFRRYVTGGIVVFLLTTGMLTFWLRESQVHGPFVADIGQIFPDELDRFEQNFDPNGEWLIVDLPGDANPNQIIEAYAKGMTNQRELFDNYRVIKTKSITLRAGSNGYYVTLIRSDKGVETFIVYCRAKNGWTVRAYDQQGRWP